MTIPAYILQDVEPGQQLDLGQDLFDYSEPTAEESYWATLIVGHLRSSIECVLAAGLDLTNAKEALPHGSWLPMLALAGVGARKAQVLMQIAANPVLSDPQHAAALPSDWTTLSILARLGEDELARGIEEGAITSQLGRDDARDLARGPQERDLGDDDTTMDPEPAKAKPTAQEYAESRDAAVFSARQGHQRLSDCLKLIKAPGFRLTVEVAQDINRELVKVDKVYGDLLLYIDEEAGSATAPRARSKGPSVVIPAKSAVSGGMKAGRTEVALGGQSDHIGDQTITIEDYYEREGR